MLIKRYSILIISFLGFINFPIKTTAQTDTIHYDISASGLISSGDYAPFWLQNKSYGTTSSKPGSSQLNVSAEKNMNRNGDWFDFGGKFSAECQVDKTGTNVFIDELYLKTRLFFVDFSIGAKHEIYGNQDSVLSCGGLLFSQNSRAIPKIYAGIENFKPIPFTYGYLEIKGGLSHGVFNDNIYVQSIFLHHKYAYARVGGKLPVNIQYGLDHVAQWGGTHPIYGKMYDGFNDYLNIFFIHGGGNITSEQINAQGNHIISQSAKIELKISNFRISGYMQNISEDRPIKLFWEAPNKSDGLWGMSVKNKNFPFIKSILYEYLSTTDQSGPYHDKDGIIYGGNDSYFYNGIYPTGWSYFQRTIGTPFITSSVYNKNGEIYITNNRTQVHHFGLSGEFGKYYFKALASFSKNYGTYNKPYSACKTSSDFLLDVNHKFEHLWGINAGLKIGADFGAMYGNNTGIQITLRKSGDLWKW
ncbi:MAG: capsule assembly Wzi family protein [Paludibacter sp.]|nr:capsule assembly Wzi family protein [Paludibacter sp.]